MKKRKTYLISLAIIYAVLFFCKKNGIYFYLIGDYAADLICIPLSLLFIEWLMGKIPNTHFNMDGWKIMVAVIYFSIVFEGIMPRFSVNYTRDYFDILMYSVGGLIYYSFFLKFSFRKNATISKPIPNH